MQPLRIFPYVPLFLNPLYLYVLQIFTDTHPFLDGIKFILGFRRLSSHSLGLSGIIGRHALELFLILWILLITVSLLDLLF